MPLEPTRWLPNCGPSWPISRGCPRRNCRRVFAPSYDPISRRGSTSWPTSPGFVWVVFWRTTWAWVKPSKPWLGSPGCMRMPLKKTKNRRWSCVRPQYCTTGAGRPRSSPPISRCWYSSRASSATICASRFPTPILWSPTTPSCGATWKSWASSTSVH